jgi:2',3'-cyclic-nucleotide 2'-phosphodiesterase (5'-nucleotidase family)
MKLVTRAAIGGVCLSALAVVAPPTAHAAPVEIQILATNDFHGRLQENSFGGEAGAAVLAGAVKELRAANPNTVFAAAGDLIGASTFESFIQQDKPTIDALNEAGLDVSAVGNHELDKGYDDLINRVMAPYDPDTNPLGGAEWEYVAANLEITQTGDPAVPETWTQTFGGVEVGFVGAVTEDLPSLVSPDGIADLTVTDIVDSVNTHADRLTADGADVVVMLVHEGSPTTDCGTMTDAGTTWGNIVTGVNENVDAIVSGHTHLAYNCSFPVQQWVDDGRAVTERPVVSAGQYGQNLNQLVFSVDDTTGEIVGLTQDLLPLLGNYPADPVVEAIVADAVADAEVLGAEPLGDIERAFDRARLADGTTENRGGESTLGNFVAEVQRWATEAPESGAAQIAFMNPGGLRADMAKGTVTYKEAAVVQPFANTLLNMDLTGAQIETVLEQQWQRTTDGTVPSRPFLRLGVSKGFTYTYTETPVTVAGTQTFEGEVTRMWLDGEPIDPEATYSVTVNSFLAAGGDNFRELANGTDKADTGKIDLEAMVDYLDEFASEAALAVDYSQRAVEVSGPRRAPAGSSVSFDVESWSMSAPGDRTDNVITAMLGDRKLDWATLDNTVADAPYDDTGSATVVVDLPNRTPVGMTTLSFAGARTGTEILVPIRVRKGDVRLTRRVRPHPIVKGETEPVVTVEVSNADGVPTRGTVTVWARGIDAVTAKVRDGVARLRLDSFPRAGEKVLRIKYSGSKLLRAERTQKTIRVRRR